jgi:hypothetical protein
MGGNEATGEADSIAWVLQLDTIRPVDNPLPSNRSIIRF